MYPRQIGDFRERVRRETIRGRYGVFHQSIEEYWYRHLRCYTVPRATLPFAGSWIFFFKSLHVFGKVFNNLEAYKGFSHHPNYKLLGPLYSHYYKLMPLVWGYVALRMTRFYYYMVRRWYHDNGDPHYFWYYDNLYPDFITDQDDMRYINFPYADQPVGPEEMSGFFPFEHLKYQEFIDQKMK